MCKSSLQQREGLLLQYFSTYWVLIGSDEKEKKKLGRENWKKNALVIVIIFYMHTTEESVGPQTVRRLGQCKQTTRAVCLVRSF